MRIRIRDLVDPGSGMEKLVSEIRERDKHPGSATMLKTCETVADRTEPIEELEPTCDSPSTTSRACWQPSRISLGTSGRIRKATYRIFVFIDMGYLFPVIEEYAWIHVLSSAGG
jgi:hypothetical protein